MILAALCSVFLNRFITKRAVWSQKIGRRSEPLNTHLQKSGFLMMWLIYEDMELKKDKLERDSSKTQ